MTAASNKEIASRLGISEQSVKNRLTALYRRLGVSSRLELVIRLMGGEAWVLSSRWTGGARLVSLPTLQMIMRRLSGFFVLLVSLLVGPGCDSLPSPARPSTASPALPGALTVAEASAPQTIPWQCLATASAAFPPAGCPVLRRA